MFSSRTSNFARPGTVPAMRLVQPRAPRAAPSPAQLLGPQDLTDIIKGAAFLSVGGGGPVSLGQELAAVIGSNDIQLVDVDHVRDEDFVVCSAYVGSPAAAAQLSSPTFNSLKRAVQTLEESAGVRVNYIVPGELGAVNSIAPMLAALDLGLPVVDADGCGRAVPILDATTFGQQDELTAEYGAALANDADDASSYQEAVLYASNIDQVYGAAGALIMSSSYNGLGAVAIWLMSGAQLKQFAVAGTLSRARILGAALREANAGYDQVAVALLNSFGTKARVLFDGTLLQATAFPLETVEAQDQGSVLLTRQDNGETVTVYTVNENIYADSEASEDPVILSPDMLAWLGEDGSTFDNSELQTMVNDGTAPLVWAVGVEATQLVGAPSLDDRPCFRDDIGIQDALLEPMRPMGYAGPYVPFDAG